MKDQKIFIYNDEDVLIGEFDESAYNEFINIVKFQNYVGVKEEDENPADDDVAELLEQRKKARETVAKVKQEKGGEPLSIADYISILSVKSLDLDVSVILNKTMYSFYDYLERLLLVENFDLGVQQILAGADHKKVKLQHWATKI